MAAKTLLSNTEPTFERACQWWSETTNIWTPLGWKDHFFRFNVLWNGTILAEPGTLRGKRGEGWKGKGMQIALATHHSERFKEIGNMSAFLRADEGMVRQGWEDSDAPVLWSDYARDGVTMRASMFAHVPGGGDVKTGIEPLFLWVRLTTTDLCEALPLEDIYGFHLLLQNPHVRPSMQCRENLQFDLDKQTYQRPLSVSPKNYSRRSGQQVIEKGGKVRLGVMPGGDCTQTYFFKPTDRHPFHVYYVPMPTRRGMTTDLLIAMLPVDRKTFDAEAKLGYARAKQETQRYWKRIMRTSTRFEVPEPAINAMIRHCTRFSPLLAEKNPATGKYCKISGSLAYNALWSTPTAMEMTMMLNTLGRPELVEPYLGIFHEEQGTVKPPGDAYSMHPGYLSSPALYKSHDWLSDNGALLYTLAMHGLLTGNRRYIAQYADALVRSCEFIRDARALRNHGGYEGVMAAAATTDRDTVIQSVFAIGWNYKGLIAAVRLLKQIGHPRAGEFEREARGFREAFLRALRHKCKSMPTWRDRRGRKRVFVPTSLTAASKAESRDPFYLDTGPLFLVFAGLLDAADPLMDDLRTWFREGPQWRQYRMEADSHQQMPVLKHEISSCEPCYSWNIFHSHQLGDRERFLEGMYSLFAGGMSRRTWVSCETRGGITGNLFTAPLAIYLARLAVIDDELHDDELHLLRILPAAWAKPDDTCRFDNMPTMFGPVTLRTKRSRDGKTLEVEWKPKFRATPRRVVVHRPPLEGLNRVVVNGRVLPRGKKMAGLM